jgi:hypothetical protein
MAPIASLTQAATSRTKLRSRGRNGKGEGTVLWTIIVILLILWLLGGFVRPVGGLIHLILVVILILVIIELLG